MLDCFSELLFFDQLDAIDLWSSLMTSNDPDIDEHKKLSLEDLATLIRRQKLRWFGHIERFSEQISWVRSMSISNRRVRLGLNVLRTALLPLSSSSAISRTELVGDHRNRTVN